MQKLYPNKERLFNLYRESEKNKSWTSSFIWYLIPIVLGISALVTQFVLLREFIAVFYGNELVIGVILSNWMILTGAGSFLGRYTEIIRNKNNLTIILLILIGVLPIVTAFLLSFLKNTIYPVGSLINIIQIFYNSFFLLLPFCVISGFLFTHLADIISKRHADNLIAKVYSLESFGSIIGGAIFNLLIIFYLKTFETLKLLLLLNLIVAFILAYKTWKGLKLIFLALLSIAIINICYNVNLDFLTKKFLFPDQEIEYYHDTPYGNLVITEQGEQKNFYENNILMFTTNEVMTNEEVTHYAMIQHTDPKKILLISGGISGTIDELLKYNIDKIDYVELNPWIIKIGEKYSSALHNIHVNTINEDGRLFVKKTKEKYDAIIINLPAPSTAQINRYYTTEFFSQAKEKLNSKGIISMSSIASADYMSGEALQISSILYNTLKKSFRNVLIIPGLKNYFIASDGKLDINIAKLIQEKGIENKYVNQYYIDDKLLKERSDYITTNLDKDTRINEDFNPVSYYQQLLYWLSYFQFNYWIIPIVLILLVAFLFKKFDTISFGIFAGGFAASSIEVLLLLSFQILFGYVYQMLGVIITLFFCGLAAGAMFYNKIFKKTNIHSFIKTQIAIVIYSFCLPVIFVVLKSLQFNDVVIHGLFFVLTFIISLIIGIEFALAAKLKRGNVAYAASEVYSFDLIGSAFGALLVTVYLIPILGIFIVGMIIGAVNLIAVSISIVNSKKYL